MRLRYLFAAMVAPTLLLVPIAALPAEAASAVRISYVQYDSPGADSGSNKSLNAEWVRIKNGSSKKKTLTGWSLRDAQGHVYRFGTFTLRAGRSVRIHTGTGSNTGSDRFWRQDWYVWNNSGDKAILKNKAGSTVDTCKWGDGDGNTGC